MSSKNLWVCASTHSKRSLSGPGGLEVLIDRGSLSANLLTFHLHLSPIDFSKMESKLDANAYPNFEAFVADAYLVFSNCLIYNPETTTYAKQAVKMEKFVKDWVAQRQAT